jgi:hypothetical protein
LVVGIGVLGSCSAAPFACCKPHEPATRCLRISYIVVLGQQHPGRSQGAPYPAGVEPRAYPREAILRAVRNPGTVTLARELK